MAEPRVETTCDACGQTDDHPVIHVGYWTWQKDERTTVANPTFHFDCIPPEVEAMLGIDAPEHAVTVAAIEKARSGVHGDKLLKFIEDQPSDNDVTVEG